MTLYITIGALLVILLYGVFFAVNNMGKCTQHGIRIAWVLMIIGGVRVLLNVLLSPTPPSWPMAILSAGVALYVLNDRRCRFICPEIKGESVHDVTGPSSQKSKL